MIVFKLNKIASVSEITDELSHLMHQVSFQGFEDFNGRSMYEGIDYVRFADENDAVQFVLIYGDKYQPERTDHIFTPGIIPF